MFRYISLGKNENFTENAVQTMNGIGVKLMSVAEHSNGSIGIGQRHRQRISWPNIANQEIGRSTTPHASDLYVDIDRLAISFDAALVEVRRHLRACQQPSHHLPAG